MVTRWDTFSRASRHLRVFTLSFDWSIDELSITFAFGQCDDFGFKWFHDTQFYYLIDLFTFVTYTGENKHKILFLSICPWPSTLCMARRKSVSIIHIQCI